jgi:hypothetical protein
MLVLKSKSDDKHRGNSEGGRWFSGEPDAVKVARPVRRGVWLRRVTASLNCIRRIHGEAIRKPHSSSDLPEMRGNPKGTHRRSEKQREEKSGIQDATARAGGYGKGWIA